jgi:predicted Zn-dependent protease
MVVALGLVSCDAPTIPEETFAYDPRLPGGFVYHWPTGSTISIFVDPEAWPTDVDPGATVLEAFRQWEEVSFYRDFNLRLVSNAAEADVIVHHEGAPFLVDVSECAYPDASASGVTFFCPSESLDSLQVLPLLAGGPGRVKMDVRISSPRLSTQQTFQNYVSHEIGHVLGIGAHSNDPADLMYVGSLTVSAPTERDARTLRWVLRQPVDVRP